MSEARQHLLFFLAGFCFYGLIRSTMDVAIEARERAIILEYLEQRKSERARNAATTDAALEQSGLVTEKVGSGLAVVKTQDEKPCEAPVPSDLPTA